MVCHDMGFLAFLVPSISSLPSSFFLLLLVFPLCVCYILCVCPMVLGGSLPLPFFSRLWSLCLLVLGGSIRISVYPVSFLNCVRFIHKPIKDILLFFCSVFTSRIYFLFFFFRICIFAYAICCFLFILSFCCGGPLLPCAGFI